MPGKEVKNWKVYHECMASGKHAGDKEYCARVANAVAAGTIKHALAEDSDALALIVNHSIRMGVQDGNKQS